MLSVVIVNYRSWHYLSHCLEAIYIIPQLEIVVVDNHSADNEIEKFKQKYPNVKWVISNLNLGFGRACNLGVENAKNETILFLNPDTLANKEALMAMHRFLKENPTFKIVSCKQHQNLKKHFLLFPNLFRMFGLLRALAVKQLAHKFRIQALNNQQFIEPDWVSGSVLMTTKTWLKQINGYTTDFWMYSEDLEICKKTVVNGGQIALLTEVEIYHKHGGASRKNIEIAAITKAEVIKSKHVYYQLYFKGIEKYLAHLIMLLNFIFIKFPLAIIGQIFFFVPKLFLQTKLFLNLCKYYVFVFKNKNWMSEKTVELKDYYEN